MKREVELTATFERALRKLRRKNQAAADAIVRALGLLSEDMFDPLLRTHPLQGKLNKYYASKAGYDLRIMFRVVTNEREEYLLMIACGSHDEIY